MTVFLKEISDRELYRENVNSTYNNHTMGKSKYYIMYDKYYMVRGILEIPTVYWVNNLEFFLILLNLAIGFESL